MRPDHKEILARNRAVKGWAFRLEDGSPRVAEYRAFVRGYGPCPSEHLSTYRLCRRQLGLTMDWYEAFADAVHAMGKKWPDELTKEEEAIAEMHADDVAPRPEAEKRPTPPGEPDNKHDYRPADPDRGRYDCEICGFGRHHPWHTGE